MELLDVIGWPFAMVVPMKEKEKYEKLGFIPKAVSDSKVAMLPAVPKGFWHIDVYNKHATAVFEDNDGLILGTVEVENGEVKEFSGTVPIELMEKAVELSEKDVDIWAYGAWFGCDHEPVVIKTVVRLSWP